MELIPWNGSSLATLQQQMNRLFQDFFGPEGTRLATPANGTFGVALDVAETPDAVIVRAEVPGIDPAKVEIAITGDHLTLSGEKSAEKEEKGKTWHRIERTYGRFTRSVLLPAPVDADKVEARAKDGVLTITLPKTVEARPKRITVKAG